MEHGLAVAIAGVVLGRAIQLAIQDAAPPAAPAPAPATVPAAAPVVAVVPREWLVLPPVDARGRRPFNPNAPFAKYLLDPASPPPAVGDKLTGELGVEKAWAARQADEDGTVGGGPAQIAFTTVEWPEEAVALADLDGAATVWVNGVPQVGDVYGDGMGGLPVAMKQGSNAIYVTGTRGGFRLEFRRPEAALIVNAFDATRGDLSPLFPEPRAALLVVNATLATWDRIEVITGGDDVRDPEHLFARQSVVLAGLGPLGSRKIALPIELDDEHLAATPAKTVTLPVRVRMGPHLTATTITFERRGAGELARCAYLSDVDGSVQEFALLPPSTADVAGLVLTLHGAGVDCWGQAAAYSKKPDFWIVAPTNRRRFGFDWQDWGRRDALDVLATTLQRTRVDRDRVCLTGHSMGGHGTWHLAANDPDAFAAIAPSAGWSGFDSYGGGRPKGALAELWQSADASSRTLDLVDNLNQIPTFILHGSADDNVPLSEAQLMLDALTKAGGKPRHHFQEGAGHWWDGDAAPGADCVDWPAIFDLFRSAVELRREPRRAFSFTTADPAVADRYGFVRIVQPLEYGKPARVDFAIDVASGIPTLTTSNVRRLELDIRGDGALVPWKLDGQDAELAPPPAARRLSQTRDARWLPPRSLLRTRGAWIEDHVSQEIEKTPLRSGPFKRVFDQRFVLVHGTNGDEAEDRELRQRARYDAAHWWYRANGHALVLSDAEFLRDFRGYDERNVILYGNADTNRAWASVVDESCPIVATRGELQCGEQSWKGDALAALFVRPRRPVPVEEGMPSSAGDCLVGVFASTGVAGARLGYTLAPFISGVGYPDYSLFSADVLSKGDGGVLAAGWFAHDWSLPAAK